jgi:hypothetical protein
MPLIHSIADFLTKANAWRLGRRPLLEKSKHINVACPNCRHSNQFDQPYPYHAGFGDQVFLYNDAGTHTLVWSAWDPTSDQLFGAADSRNPPADVAHRIEAVLPPAPDGTRWRFENPPRCGKCHEPIGGSLTGGSIYYYLYPGSVQLGSKTQTLGQYVGGKSEGPRESEEVV